jgi:hypothetical protein
MVFDDDENRNIANDDDDDGNSNVVADDNHDSNVEDDNRRSNLKSGLTQPLYWAFSIQTRSAAWVPSLGYQLIYFRERLSNARASEM